MSDYDNYDNNNQRRDSGEGNDGERGIGSFFGKGNNNNNQQQHQQQQQQHQFRPNQYGPPQGPPPSGPSQSHYGQNPYGNNSPGGGSPYSNSPGPRPGSNMVGGAQHGGNMPGGGYSQEEIEKNQRNDRMKDWGTKAGIAALGAAAIGAAAYGIHEWREDKQEEEEEEKRKEESKRREEEDKRRREEEERRRREQQQHQQQQQQHHGGPGGPGGWNSPGPGSNYGGSQQSHQQQQPPSHYGGSDSGSGFRPPVPMGRHPYSFDQNDVRNADPSRSSENSPTPREYPQLRHTGSDNVIKMGSIVALKHNMTGRFLHTDRSHNTQTGSNQQLVFGFRWNPDENDWWQVLPANHDVPVPGAIVTYGTQIRLRHLQTGRHLHSHYNYRDPKCGQNEVTAYGDQAFSDENDHWVVERWGTGSYGQTWEANDVVVFRHYVSGMTLHSHDILVSEDVQSVTCFGPGGEENDKWRVKFD